MAWRRTGHSFNLVYYEAPGRYAEVLRYDDFKGGPASFSIRVWRVNTRTRRFIDGYGKPQLRFSYTPTGKPRGEALSPRTLARLINQQ